MHEFKPTGLPELVRGEIEIASHDDPGTAKRGEDAGSAVQKSEVTRRKALASPQIARDKIDAPTAPGAHPSGLNAITKFSMFSRNPRKGKADVRPDGDRVLPQAVTAAGSTHSDHWDR